MNKKTSTNTKKNTNRINVHGEQKVKTIEDRYYSVVKNEHGGWGDITIGRNFGNVEMW